MCGISGLQVGWPACKDPNVKKPLAILHTGQGPEALSPPDVKGEGIKYSIFNRLSDYLLSLRSSFRFEMPDPVWR